MAKKTLSKTLVFPKAGHFILVPYGAGNKLNFSKAYNSRSGIVNSITRESSLNTVDLPDGNSTYPAKTYVQTQAGTVTMQLSTYDPRLEALLSGATYQENEQVREEMWYNGELIVSKSENNNTRSNINLTSRASLSNQTITIREPGPAVKDDGTSVENFDYANAYTQLGIKLNLKTATIETENLDLSKIPTLTEVVHTIDGVKRAYMGIQFTAPDSAVKVKVSHTPNFENANTIDLTKESQDVYNGQYIDYIGFAAEVNGEWEKMPQRSISFYFQWLDAENKPIKTTIKTINVQGTVSYSSILNPIPNNVEQLQITDQYGNLFEAVDSIATPITKGHFFIDTDTGEIKFAADDKDETLYLAYTYYGTNIATVAYSESPKMSTFQAIIINETKDMNETTYQRVNTIIDNCSVSGSVTPPAQTNNPTGGWTITFSISKSRSGKNPIMIKFEQLNEETSDLAALDEDMKKQAKSFAQLSA